MRAKPNVPVYNLVIDLAIDHWLQLSSGWVAFDDVSLRPVATYNLTYDAENRLVEVKKNSVTQMTFAYDGDGQRVKSTLAGSPNSTVTRFVGNWYEYETTGAATTTRTYYYAGGMRVALRVGAVLYYLLGDHLGSASLSYKSDGTDTHRQLYRAWGEVRWSSASLPTRYTYTGQWKDSYSNLIWMNSRWYDSKLGRFISPDIIIPEPYNPLAHDRYQYVYSNPLKYVDPSGHDPCTGVVGTYMPDCGVDCWFGPPFEIWSEAEITQAHAEFGVFGRFIELVGSILVEPIDWGLIARDCATGDCSPWVFLGILPGIPGSIGRQADETVRLLNPPNRANFPWHHLLPQRFRERFAKIGIDIEDHLVSIPKRIHDLIHGKGPKGGLWNNAWDKWLKDNPNATPEDIFKQLGVLIREFNLDGIIKRVKK